MAEYLKSEIKSGIMIVSCILILVVLIFLVGGLELFKKESSYKIYFKSIAQLGEGAPVTFAGHKIGRIKSIAIIPEKDKPVEIIISLPSKIEIRADSLAEIKATGVIGLKCLSLSPGSKDAPVLPSGSIIKEKEPLDIQEIINAAGSLGDNVAETIASIKATSDRFRSVAEKVDDAKLGQLLKNINIMVEENREDIREIIKNLKDTTANAREFTAIIKKRPSRLIWRTRERRERKTEIEKLRRPRVP